MLLWSPHLQQVVDVPDDQVQQGVVSGEFEPFKGKVNVVSPDGVAGSVDAANAIEAFRTGYTFETAGDQAARELREEYDDPMFAGIMGSMRGTTMGLSDVALAQGEGGDERAAALNMLKEENPVISTGAEIAGAIAPALVSGGAATPAGAANLLGRGAEQVVAKGLGKTGGSAAARIASRSAELGTGGAVEGALYGAGHVLSEDALAGDDGVPLTAAQLAAGAGFGALVGGGAGAIFGGGLQSLSELAARNRRVADGVVEAFESAEGVTAENGTKGFISDLVKKGGEWKDDIGAFMFNAPKEDIKVFTRPTAEGAWNVEVAFGENAGKVRELFLDEATDGYSKILDIVKRARIESGGDLKVRGVGKHVAKHVDEQAAALRKMDPMLQPEKARQQAADAMFASAAPEARSFMQRFIGVLKSIDEMPPGSMDKLTLIKSKEGLLNAAKQYQKELDVIIGKEPGFGRQSDPVKAITNVFDVLDRTKQRIGNPMRKLLKQADPTEQATATRKFLGGDDGEAGGIYDEFRRFLERDDLWGGAAVMQREVNEAASKYWGWLRHGDARRFVKPVERELDAKGAALWEQSYRGDRDGFKRLQNAFGSGDEAEMAHFLMGSTDDLRGWVGVIKKNYDLTKKGRATLDEAEAAVDAFQKGLGKHKKAVSVQNQAKRLIQSVNSSSGSSLPVRGGTLGFLLGGGPGAIAGALAEHMFHPVKRIERIARMQGAKKWWREKAGKSVERIVSKAKQGAKWKPPKFRKPVGSTSFFLDFSINDGDRGKESRTQAFKRVHRELTQLASDPEMLNARLARTLGEGMTVAPNVSAEIVQQAQRAMAYLMENLPTPPSGDNFNPTFEFDQWVPSDMEMSEFANRMRAVEDPLSQLDDLYAGALTPEGAEALRAVHGLLAEGMAQEVISQIIDLGTDLPRADKIQLSLLTGVAMDSSMQPESLLALQANFGPDQGGPGPQQPRVRPPDFERRAEDMEARSEKLAEV